MANKFDLEALKASNFEGAARTHVEKAYLLLTGEPEESLVSRDVEELRLHCQKLTALAEINTMAPPPKADLGIPTSKVVGRIPNLTPSGVWEGKKRRVMVIDPDPESKKKTVTVCWEGIPWDFNYGETVDMPWPYWNALKDAQYRDDRSVRAVKWQRSDEGELSKLIKPIVRPMHNYQDYGDTPGTEDLPESYFDFFRQRAIATSCFRELKIPMLLMIHERLFDGPPRDRDHKMVQLDAITIRLRIAERLGPELVTLLNSEIFEAA